MKNLKTVQDFIRYATSRFSAEELFFGHGTQTAYDEAVFMILEALHLPIDTVGPWLPCRLTAEEKERLTALIDKRISTRLPAPYLLNKAYMHGMPFYVDERVLVPRSFIGDLLVHDDFFGEDGTIIGKDVHDVERVLDLCTGSGCLAIMAAHIFPNAHIDAADLSPDALDVARKNVDAYGLEDRIRLIESDVFTGLDKGKDRYDLIITNPPYVDRMGMDHLPPEYEHEPSMALAAGDDGLEIVHKILDNAKSFLERDGALICEIGRCKADLESQRPNLPYTWLDTEGSSGEGFMIYANELD